MSNPYEDAEKSLRMVVESKDLVFDTETSGVDWRVNFPVGWVIWTPEQGVYVPTRHAGGGNLPDKVLHRRPSSSTDKYTPHSYEVALAKAFKERERLGRGRVIGHNIKFDCHFAANVGVLLGRALVCTQNNQALIDEFTKSYSLDSLAKSYGVAAKKGDELYASLASRFGGPADRTSMQHFWKTSGDEFLVQDYSIGDGASTFGVHKKQQQEIIDQELEYICSLEQDLIWTLFRAERRGIKLDLDYLRELEVEVQTRVNRAMEALPPGFNTRSPAQVRDYVSQFATDWPTTEKGNPSFPEKWLKTFPEGANIVTVRKWTNLYNSFAQPLLNEHSFNGRVHATLNQNKADEYGTVSGRLSCSNPNMQQVPKHNKEIAELFRKAFVADEGMWIREGDYSQMEPRMFAHYSQEPALVNGYRANPPRDVHTVVAELFQRDRSTVAKRMNMGMFTGMFPESFAGHMGVSLKEATDLWNKWFEYFPAIKDFQDKAKRRIIQRGYVKSILGRRGRLESNRLAYKATSRIIQNGGADVIKYKMLEIDREFERLGNTSHLLMSVHDSLMWQNPKGEEGDAVSKWVVETMVDVQKDPFNFRVPFAVDVGRGDNWAEASFGGKK